MTDTDHAPTDVLRGALATLGFGACAVVIASHGAGLPALDVGITRVAAWTVLAAIVALVGGATSIAGVGAGVVGLVVASASASPYPPVMAVVVVAAGVLLARLMQRRRPSGPERAARIVLQASSLLAGLVVVLEQGTHPSLPSFTRLSLDELGIDDAGLLGIVAVVVGAACCVVCLKHLVAEGGTADPFDPPLSLCRTGPYRLLRHPMQLGQILVIVGLALCFATVGAVVIAVGIVAVLLGPVRWFEARQLATRFGPL